MTSLPSLCRVSAPCISHPGDDQRRGGEPLMGSRVLAKLDLEVNRLRAVGALLASVDAKING